MNRPGEAGYKTKPDRVIANAKDDRNRRGCSFCRPVQPKAVMFPTDAKLLNRARERLVRLAKKLGVSRRMAAHRFLSGGTA
jgi:hypothetical protein